MKDLYRNLSILSHVLHRTIAPDSLRSGGLGALSKQQYEAMQYIQNHPDAHPSKLAKAFDISVPTVSNMLQRLEQKGYIQKTPSMEDQRAINIQLTETGAAKLEEVEQERRAQISQLVEPLTQEERDTLEEGIVKLLQAITKTQDRNLICLHCGNAHSNRCILMQGLTCGQARELQ